MSLNQRTVSYDIDRMNTIFIVARPILPLIWIFTWMLYNRQSLLILFFSAELIVVNSKIQLARMLFANNPVSCSCFPLSHMYCSGYVSVIKLNLKQCADKIQFVKSVLTQSFSICQTRLESCEMYEWVFRLNNPNWVS